MSNFLQIQSGNFRALVRPENLAKVEDKLAKVKPPVHSIPKPSAQDRARLFPVYKPGMSTADYVRQFERANGKTGLNYVLNENPAAQYDPLVPLCVEDANPDYIPGVDDAPVKPKAKSARRDPKAERIAALEDALQWVTACLLNPNGAMDQLAAIEKAQSLLGGEK